MSISSITAFDDSLHYLTNVNIFDALAQKSTRNPWDTWINSMDDHADRPARHLVDGSESDRSSVPLPSDQGSDTSINDAGSSRRSSVVSHMSVESVRLAHTSAESGQLDHISAEAGHLARNTRHSGYSAGSELSASTGNWGSPVISGNSETSPSSPISSRITDSGNPARNSTSRLSAAVLDPDCNHDDSEYWASTEGSDASAPSPGSLVSSDHRMSMLPGESIIPTRVAEHTVADGVNNGGIGSMTGAMPEDELQRLTRATALAPDGTLDDWDQALFAQYLDAQVLETSSSSLSPNELPPQLPIPRVFLPPWLSQSSFPNTIPALQMTPPKLPFLPVPRDRHGRRMGMSVVLGGPNIATAVAPHQLVLPAPSQFPPTLAALLGQSPLSSSPFSPPSFAPSPAASSWLPGSDSSSPAAMEPMSEFLVYRTIPHLMNGRAPHPINGRTPHISSPLSTSDSNSVLSAGDRGSPTFYREPYSARKKGNERRAGRTRRTCKSNGHEVTFDTGELVYFLCGLPSSPSCLGKACAYAFTDRGALDRHVTNSHAMREWEELWTDQVTDPGKLVFGGFMAPKGQGCDCNICGKRLSRPDAARRHEALHTESDRKAAARGKRTATSKRKTPVQLAKWFTLEDSHLRVDSTVGKEKGNVLRPYTFTGLGRGMGLE
ncbi:hypothetical protein DACRYDRAFT_17463 [Dacryopinax primogenitus]|uniref:C2H2-type domain-containing protein n=1 Tax=Dacryopinax primogenitus (strain DJM 731) TaxID=1858805 RepID=M5FUT9_DACPD|nr:uncharacterized protein DACRYDRAFT_17463 [Dacryopinax primogenitus]EJT99279.1 hypothetical protein DACRYDRAFT_17463 [Dacryopinax primogenitus]